MPDKEVDEPLVKPGKAAMLDANWGKNAINAASHIEYANMAALLNQLITQGFAEAADALVEEFE